MRVLGFGTYDLDRHPRAGVLLEGLREHGDDVREVTSPLGLDTERRVRLLKQPWRLPLLALRIVLVWARIAVRGWWVARRWHPDVVLVGYLGHFDVLLARVLFPRTTLVLDHLIFAADTAVDRGSGHRLLLAVLRALDRLALRAADVVVVDTDEHAAMVTGSARADVVVVPVGATRSWFDAAHEPLVEALGTPLRVVMFGLFTPLHGTTVVARALRLVAERGVDVQVLMVGHGQDHAAALALVGDNPRVRWESWVPADELPAVVAAHDVCLGILGDRGKALRVVPNKVFQGAAAGCAVLTSDTPAQRRAMDGAAVLLPPGDPEALATALAQLADDPHRVLALRRAARSRALERYTPATVVDELRRQLLSRSGVSAGR
ncbi:MAG: glycosyltransferase [Mycobacteriaceae bacterium]